VNFDAGARPVQERATATLAAGLAPASTLWRSILLSELGILDFNGP
jgi:hypothetical protein